MHMSPKHINFDLINTILQLHLPDLLWCWLPDGWAKGRAFIARNPRGADRNPGSFKSNLRTGRWADFATGDRGHDPTPLASYLFGLSRPEAARKLAVALGLSNGGAAYG